MKIITSLALCLLFTFNLMAKDNYPDLKSVSKLSDIKENNSLTKYNVTDLNATKKKKKDFEFSINPYAWFTAIGGTVAVPTVTYNGKTYASNYNFSFNKSASDAIKNLKMAAMFDGRFKYKQWSFLYDFAYINLKNFDAELPGNLDTIAGRRSSSLTANTTAKEMIIDLAIGYLFPSKTKGFFLTGYIGTRLMDVDAEVTLVDSVNNQIMGQKKNSWLDPILGIHAQWIYGKDKWATALKGDLGGFGVNSQFTIMMSAIQSYRVSQNFDINLGFKWLGMNYNKEASVWNVNNYGLLLGFGVRL